MYKTAWVQLFKECNYFRQTLLFIKENSCEKLPPVHSDKYM